MAERKQDFYSSFEQPNDNSVIISRGPNDGRIALKAAGERLHVIVLGEPEGECLTGCFREGLDRGVLRPNMRALVDLTRFTGAVDWSAIYTVRVMAPWGNDKDASRIAYVVRNNMFGALIKIAGVLFSNSRHRTFDDFDAAVAWLESDGRE